MRSLPCVFVVALIASACGSSATSPTTPALTYTPYITFLGTEFLIPGQMTQLTAVETLATGAVQDVTSTSVWASSAPFVATVSSTGLVTAVGVGATSITATVGGTVGSWVVSVASATATSMLVYGPNSIGSAQNFQMSAIISLKGGATQDVTSAAAWQSSNAAVATVSSSGVLTTVAPGTTTISATYQGIAGTWLVTVNDTVTALSLFGNNTLTASTMQTAQFSAAATMSSGPVQNVTNPATWVSSNPAVATVSGTGLVTAVVAGTTEITATYNGFSASVLVTVN